MQEIGIQDRKDLVRDLRTGAIINSDPHELEVLRRRKAKILKERDRDREVDMIKAELRDIRLFMGEIYEKLAKL